MAELKPCPFCGHKPTRVAQHIVGSLAIVYYTVGCSECLVKPKTAFYRSKEEAIKVWNRRAGDGNGN